MTNPDTAAPVASVPAAFTHQQVLDAVNEAANDILHAVHAGDEGLRDSINLLVNATIAYLCGEAEDLQDVVEGSYGEDYQHRARFDRGGGLMSWWDGQDQRRQAAIAALLESPRGQDYLRHANGDRGFAAWLLVADTTCARRLGVSIFDIADWTWRAAYDTGQQPGAAVRDAVQADDTFKMLLGGE